MTNDRFFRGFLAALRLQGEKRIVTKNDAHHQTFDAAARWLEEARRSGCPGVDDMPDTLVPQVITGRYQEWDSALVSLQRGRLLAARNPTYPLVEILFDDEEARQLLELYTPEQREVFTQMATRYMQQPVSA
ncbi:MAG: hypothetical protein M3335_05150 [Actinomycetota bacterium]|nr:hypothetical protein [Actinomycetota bacterium]